jgi:carotenoid cleavage dioxygenase-like enzyme
MKLHPLDVVGGSRKASYAYCAIFDETDKIMGVAKYDLRMEPSPTASREIKAEGNIAGVFQYGPGRAGGEAIFVPRKPGMDGSPEDDGYLISFVHDENTE